MGGRGGTGGMAKYQVCGRCGGLIILDAVVVVDETGAGVAEVYHRSCYHIEIFVRAWRHSWGQWVKRLWPWRNK